MLYQHRNVRFESWRVGRERSSLEPWLAHRNFEILVGKEPKIGNDAETLIEQARALPPEDRIALVEDVLDSLDHADPEIDRLWRGRLLTLWQRTGAVSLPPRN